MNKSLPTNTFFQRNSEKQHIDLYKRKTTAIYDCRAATLCFWIINNHFCIKVPGIFANHSLYHLWRRFLPSSIPTPSIFILHAVWEILFDFSFQKKNWAKTQTNFAEPAKEQKTESSSSSKGDKRVSHIVVTSPSWQYHKYFFFRIRQTTATEVKLKPFEIRTAYRSEYTCMQYTHSSPLSARLMMKMMCDIHLLRLSAIMFIYFLGPSFRIS